LKRNWQVGIKYQKPKTKRRKTRLNKKEKFMNTNCLADCKHKEICKLTAEDTDRCKLKGDEWVKCDGKILGMTTKQICCKQGGIGDLDK